LCKTHYDSNRKRAKKGAAPGLKHDPPIIAPAPVFDSGVARAAAAAISELLSGAVWHESLTALVHALDSGSAEKLQEAVLANQLMLLNKLPGDAPVPETLWGYYTPWGFCPVHITTRLSVAVEGRGQVLAGSCQFSFETEEDEEVRNLGEASKKKKKKTDFVSQVT
jgi:hypothetical protein